MRTTIFLLALVLSGFYFLFGAHNTYAQVRCATIQNVEQTNITPIPEGVRFTCIVTVDQASAGSRSIACGVSINGQFPSNYCPSDENFFGGWRGNQGYFNCILPYTNEVLNANTLDLVGSDFNAGCIPQAKKSIPLTISKPTIPPSNPNNLPLSRSGQDSVQFVEHLLRAFIGLSGETSITPPIALPTEIEVNPTGPIAILTRTPPSVSRAQEAERVLNSCHISSRTSVDGAPTITAEKMRQVLQSYNSPATGDTQVIYDLGARYNINPAVLLAFFIKESSAGTAGQSVANKSIGNIVCTPGFTCAGRFRRYSSWVDGAEDYYKLLRNLYLNRWGLYYVETIIPIYAPPFENDTCLYINQTINRINSWR